LNEAERRRDEAEDKRVREAVAAEARRINAATPSHELTVNDPGPPAPPRPSPAATAEPSNGGGRPAAADKRSDQEPEASAGKALDELVLSEALEMLADYVDLRATPVRAT
jgi:hypothetical protein